MKHWIAVWVAGFGLGWMPGCGGLEKPPSPDVVVIMVNGLRAQAMEEGAEAGLFEALGLSGGRGFSAAYAQSPHPVSSLASMLVGEYPSAIPFCTRPRTRDNRKEPWCTSLPSKRRLLPEILNIYGYSTGLFVTGDVGEMAGIGQRFTHLSAEPTAELSNQLRDWWKAQEASPRFAVLVTDMVPSLRRTARIGAPGGEVGAALLKSYRKESVEKGTWIGGLLAGALTASEQRERIVVVTSAHGISLAETTGTWEMPVERVFHDIVLDRTVHVPLHIFGVEDGEDVETPVQLVDLVPTLARLGGAAAPAGLPGRDLLGKPPGSGQAYSEFGDMLVLRQGELLLGARMLEHGASSLDPRITERLLHGVEPEVRFTLHDIRADSLQTRDLSRESLEDTARLRAALTQVRQEAAKRGPGMSQEQVEALRSAGALDYW